MGPYRETNNVQQQLYIRMKKCTVGSKPQHAQHPVTNGLETGGTRNRAHVRVAVERKMSLWT